MKSNIEITMSNSEGVLERILGCLRQRGFTLCSISATESADESALVAHIKIKSERSIELAVKQIRKLYDVHSVMVEAMEEGQNGYRHLQAATSQA